MRFWTISWIAIEDKRLAFAYYGGLVLIIIYFGWGVVYHHRYLELDPIQGVCRPHLSRGSGSLNGSSCVERPCGRIPPTVVEGGVSVGQSFVATHVQEVLERCGDTFCFEPQEVLKESQFFVEGVEDYMLSPDCSAQAFRFFSEECQNQELVALAQSKRLRQGASVVCPFTTSNLRAHGRLLGLGGRVLQDIPPGRDDVFSVRTWLEAAGVHLGSLSDSPDAAGGATFRREGLVLIVTVSYHNLVDYATVWDYFSFPDRGEIQYDIKVQRVAEADYHVHKSTVTESTGWRPSVVEMRTNHGILFRFVQTGYLGRFSFHELIDQIVLKLGMLTLLQLCLDLAWQYILPWFGVDYRNQVYSFIVKAVKSTAKSTVVAPAKDI